MSAFKDPMPHGEIEQPFDGVFFVTGTTRPKFDGGSWQFSRNMTVVREGESLTLINTVRLDEAGLGQLDELGKVENVVKIGSFHGYDDPFYVDRYGAKLWAFEGMTHEGGLTTDAVLEPGRTPFGGCQVFVFETSKTKEGLLLIEREGGILVSCDALQNWAEVDRFFSDESAKQMTEFGFIQPANIGPGWRRSAEPQKSDFDRVEALPFRHLVSAHGTVLRDDAHAQLSATFAAAFAD